MAPGIIFLILKISKSIGVLTLILITGVSRGLDRSIVEKLSKRSKKVIRLTRSIKDLEILCIQCDVTDYNSVKFANVDAKPNLITGEYVEPTVQLSLHSAINKFELKYFLTKNLDAHIVPK